MTENQNPEIQEKQDKKENPATPEASPAPENPEPRTFKTLEQAFSLGNGQNSALNLLRDTKQTVSVFLISGIKLEGVISAHDQYSMALTDANGNQQLIYKAKISTITVAGARDKNQQRSGYNRQGARKPRKTAEPNDIRPGGA